MKNVDTEARDQRSEAYGEAAVDSVSVADCTPNDHVYIAFKGTLRCIYCEQPAPFATAEA